MFEFTINTAPPASNSVYGREKWFWYNKIDFSNHVCHCGAVVKDRLVPSRHLFILAKEYGKVIWRAQGRLGTREEKWRLADNQVNMAACFPAKSSSNKESGYFTTIFLVGNLPCPNETCVNSLSTYSRYGIDHHYRAIHKISIHKTRSMESGKYAFIYTYYLFMNFRDLWVR